MTQPVIQMENLKASAAFYNGLVQVDQYDTQMFDVIRREGTIAHMIQYRLASGDPSRWVIQTGIGDAQMESKRALSPTAQSPTRTEGAVTLKALSGRIQFGWFDQKLAQVMPAPFQTKSKDTLDMVKSVWLLHNKQMWTGADTNIAGGLIGINGNVNYVSIPTQITTTALTVASTDSIVDAIRRKVAELMRNEDFVVRPKVIACDPMVIYFIEEEAKQANNTISQVEVVPGVVVNAIQTQAGKIPLVGDPFIPANPDWGAAAPAGQQNYGFTILDTDLIEYHHLPGTDRPHVHQVGATANATDDYVALMAGGLVVKGGDIAHAKGVVQRA